MATKPLQSVTFPDLPNKYTVPVIDNTLSVTGAAADAKKTGDEITDLKADLNQKANSDGYYEEMSVGNAEQLISTTYTEDKTPYLFRTSGGSADIGNREEDVIVGGTINWNQLVQNGDFKANTGWGARKGTLSIADGICTVTASETTALCGLTSGYPVRTQASHKYLIQADVYSPITGSVAIGYSGASGVQRDVSAETWTRVGCVWARDESMAAGAVTLYIYQSIESGAVIKYKNVTSFDLTAMFGTEIADYIYQLETATAGAGVAWFKKLFPKDYYDYDAGTQKHVEGLTAHETVGFNQWDEEWENGVIYSTGTLVNDPNYIRSKNFIPVFPNTTYYAKTPSTDGKIRCYDSNKNIIITDITSYGIFTVPDGCHYIKFYTSGATYKNDICINLSWSGYRNGEYEPYVKHSYPLDSTLTLRGIPKLDASGNLYYDGDRYLPDGTVERRYGVMDLGMLNWEKTTDDRLTVGYYFSAQSILFPSSNINKRNPKYPISQVVGLSGIIATMGATVDKISFVAGNDAFYVIDSAYTDAEAFKTAMSGIMLVYELATPTTETAQPYQTPQIVDDFGTEEYVTESIVPVGHDTKYLTNLRDKLQHLPDLADGDGFYLIQQTGHKMDLVAFHIPKATGLADGTYTLKATVSGGTPTYIWVNDSQEVTEP